MASSDDEEIVPQSVTNYYFEDEDGSPVSFAVLPVLFDDAERPDAAPRKVVLRGTADDGLQHVYKRVTAWKLGFQDDRPRVTLLLKEGRWINLLRPRKSYYEDTIRTTMIALELLHFLKKKPESSEKSLWDHLRRVFSTFEVRPSEHDFRGHRSLIKLFVERDETLSKCQLLLEFLTDNPRKRYREDSRNDPDVKQSFIADDDELDEEAGDDNGDESDEESDLFDSVCAICDNGGELLCCEGRCMRSFHPTRADGQDSECKSLGYTKSQVEAIQNFLCKNCQYNQHQCFACGKLGSSDKSAGTEVFRCVSATCGHFYHPKCVAELLFPENPAEASECRNKIAAGESFTCPVHKCVVCKQVENKDDRELQFAICRRCPKSYHRKCLPRNIAFEDVEEEDIAQRAWENLLPNRILIYCLKHAVDDDLRTPIRNHIIFPDIPEKKKFSDLQKNKVKLLAEKKKWVSDYLPGDQTTIKLKKLAAKHSSVEKSHSTGKNSKSITEQVLDSQKKVKMSRERSQTNSYNVSGAVIEDNKIAKKEKALTVIPKSCGEIISSSFPVIDIETEKKMTYLMGEVSSSVTLEYISKRCTVPSTHAYSARHIDKSITQGKVEVSVEAIREALQKLENGGSVEDAKAVCEPDILKQILKWSNKLKVYIAPFLHGMRYTSFGRHFTKPDKLIEIADKLQWYVQNGDMIVDFCCGANDFSQIMKEKLDAAGKKCHFKNYDIIQPKNDFNFEKRDWMKVQPKKLPNGSQLIMGLNPPFGVKGALANKFIDKALTFRPKLLILIVPEETERLDAKRHPYDLIWASNQSLSGKSFYLPGSVDVHDKQMEQWNMKPPVLYLWSRPDWTAKHRAVAMKHGHASDEQLEHPAEVEKQGEAMSAKELGEEGCEMKDATTVDIEITKEDYNTNQISNKRKSIENHKNKSRKKKKSKKRVEVSEGRGLDRFMNMDSSPPKTRDNRNSSDSYITSEPIKTNLKQGNHHSSNSGAGVEFGAFSGGGRSTTFHNGDFDEIALRYMTPPSRDIPYNSNSHNWPNGGMGSREYGIGSSEEQYSGYMRENSMESFGRSPYASNYDAYGRREADMRMEGRLYNIQGQDDFTQMNRFSLGGSNSGLGPAGLSTTSYGLNGPDAGISIMQRYAPRLDEPNYGRTGNPGHVPQMMQDMPPNSMTFVSGSHPPNPPSGLYPPHLPPSGGWLPD